MRDPYISIVIPAYNEEKNIPLLFGRLKKVLEGLNKNYEIIFINDGSTDNSFLSLQNLRKKFKNIKIINFVHNRGQTAAMSKGFQVARGNLIITMDADLQNFPEDIPKLIKKLNEGFDVVCGWRIKRRDNFISKKLPSYFSNLLIRKITGLEIHDFGCTLRAYKKSAIKNLHLTGEMHRFIPVILAKRELKITQVKVKHTKRIYGNSEYDSSRFIRGFLDLSNALFFSKSLQKQ